MRFNAILARFCQHGRMAEDSFISRPMSIALDAVRGGAALVVLTAHAVQQGIYTGPWPFDLRLQHNAVMVFFVLSGLVIGHSAFRRRATLADYAIARIARVVPVALFAVLLGTMAWLIGQAGNLDAIPIDARFSEWSPFAVLWPVLFLSESAFGAGPLWNPPYWSLTYEVWFYALFAVAFYLRGWQRLALLPVGTLVAGLPIMLMLPVWLLGLALARYAPARAVPSVHGVALLACGFAVINLASSNHDALRDLWTAPLGISPSSLRHGSYALSDFVVGIGVALAFVGMKPLVEQRAALLERWQPRIGWLAECSFTLYLIHWPILSLLHGWGLVAGDSALLFAAILALIVATAGQVARLTEHRRPQLRRWLAARFTRAGAAPAVSETAPPAPERAAS